MNFFATFLNDPMFSESGVYTSFEGTPKSVSILIDRNPMQERPQVGDRGAQSKALQFSICCKISKTDIPVIKEGQDTIQIPLNKGDTVLSSFIVAAIIFQDGEYWKVGIKK
jgi:hypothetical protein